MELLLVFWNAVKQYLSYFMYKIISVGLHKKMLSIVYPWVIWSVEFDLELNISHAKFDSSFLLQAKIRNLNIT